MTMRVFGRIPLPHRSVMRGVWALACAGLAMTPGCRSGPYVGRDMTPQQRAKETPATYDAYTKLGYRLDWSGFPEILGSQPVLFLDPGPDFVIAQEAGTYVTVLSTATGAQIAKDQLTVPLTKFVGMKRFGDRIYCASESELYVLDTATCNLLRRERFEEMVSTPPARGGEGNLLIFGTGNGRLIAHMVNMGVDGVKVWGFQASGTFEQGPVRVGKDVGAVTQTGDVIFLDSTTGSLMGKNRIFGGLSVRPVADDDTMYVAGLDQSIYAFAAEGGRMKWRYRTEHPLRTQPTIHNGTLYCAMEGVGLGAFDAKDGTLLWTAKGVVGTAVAMNKGRLVVWDGQDAVLVDPLRGDVVERVKLAGVRMVKPDAFENGNLYVVSNTGVIYRLVPR